MEKRKASPKLFLTVILSLIIALICPLLVQAQDSINEGVTWLLSNQNPDGSWSEEARTFLDTYTTLETLLLLNVNNAQVSKTISWVDALDLFNTDDLAHKVLVLSIAGEDVSLELSTLLSFQRTNDCWGADQDFLCDVFDTALSLRALKTINYYDQDIIFSALNYLTSTQNSDGGWGFYEEDDSNVFMTASVLKVLIPL